MSLADKLIQFLKRNDKPNPEETPEGLCPNCWGREEYGGNFYKAIKNHYMTINEDDPQIGWVQEYAEKKLNAIKLETGDKDMVCPSCKVRYKPS